MLRHVPFVFLVAAIIAVFFTGITPSFSSDDYVHLLHSTHFKNTLDSLSVFAEPYGREYRPLVRISLWFNHLMGDTALPYKITNLILHLLTTLLIYVILNRCNFSRWASILGAAIFGLHPIHVTSMHFILGRTDLIAAIFYFGTVAIVAGWKEKITVYQYIAAFLLFVAALLSKEVSITLPVIIMILIFHNRQVKNVSSFISCLKIVTPFAILAGLYLIIRMQMWSKSAGAIAEYINYTPSHVIANYGKWIFGLIYPFDLYVAQDWVLANKTFFVLLVISLSAAALIGSILIYRKQLTGLHRYFWFWFAIIWIIVTLLPMSGGNAHRWYLYIPSFGLSILAALLIDNSSEKHKNTAIACISILLGVYAIETYRLSSIWNKQSKITEAIFEQIKEKQLYKEEKLYFANIPFGFKSAYLFTHNSLEEAIEYRFGRSPVIEEINYMNLDDKNDLKTKITGNEIQFQLEPTHYRFMLLTALDRRFERPETRVVSGVTITTNQLANNKKIADYTLVISDDIRKTFYYFDAMEIKGIQ